MLGVHRRHHPDRWRQQQKRAIAFVRLGHQVIALSKLGVAAQAVQTPPNDDRRIEISAGQDRCNQRCGGGFAMRTGHCHTVFHAHQFRQHLSPWDDRDMMLPGHQHLGIVRLYRRRGHDHIRPRHISGIMPLKNGSARLLQTPGDV